MGKATVSEVIRRIGRILVVYADKIEEMEDRPTVTYEFSSEPEEHDSRTCYEMWDAFYRDHPV